eukprot:gene26609-32157_t
MHSGGTLANLDSAHNAVFDVSHFTPPAAQVANYSLSIPYSEYNSLESLYESTHGGSWVWIQGQGGIPWNFSGLSDPCFDQWQGVVCECPSASTNANNLTCTVVALELPAHNLTGPIPPVIANLTNVQTLVFERNFITSPLPDTLPLLSYLIYLDIKHNSLSETFPSWLCTLPAIQTLNVNTNSLKGTLPVGLYNMTTLVNLDVGINSLVGTVSDAISNLTSLTALVIGSNYFNGTLPMTIQSMSNLTYLNFEFTSFDGGFPLWVCNMTWLTDLRFGTNNFNGTFPSEIGNLKNLTTLWFNRNFYSGPFPEVLLTLTQLVILDMQFNLFTSTLPESISALRNLTEIYLDGNFFDGSLPCSSINQLQNMSVFSVRFMLLNGTIDGCFEGLGRISYLGLNNNMFSGQLLQHYTRSLSSFFAYNNTFTGSLTSDFPESDMQLRFYSVGNNFITGSLPSALVTLPYLSYFSINNNFLNGSLDLQPVLHSSLAQAFLDKNLFTGTIPAVLGNYSNLIELSLTGNHLSGTFPSALNNLTFLAILLIADNKLAGNLNNLYNPSVQRYVRDIDVSRNFFTGTIPGFLFHVPELSTFSADSNCLRGTLPEDICDAIQLSALVLAGVSTAHRCRRPLFPGSKSLRAFILDRRLGGTIPACIPSLPFLHTLQLAGNDLSGSLPPNMTVNMQLRDLTLSHNSLTGSIPAILQSKFFPTLDLSFNRFSGTLRSDFVGFSNKNTINMRNNRLSGDIPASFKDKKQINVLEGNMFECDASRSSLPTNDPSRPIYVCGSDELNNSVYTWCAVVGFVLISSLVGLSWHFYYFGGLKCSGVSAMFQSLHTCISLPEYVDKSALEQQHHPLSTLFRFYAHLRLVFVLLSLMLVLVLLPTYTALTDSSYTYEHQYGWTVSGVYLQGMVPAAVLLSFIGLVSLIFAGSIHYIVGFSCNDRSSHLLMSEQDKDMNSSHWSKFIFLACINIVVMFCVDSAYIYIFLNFNVQVVIASQIAMAISKIVWNEAALWNLVAFVHITDKEAVQFNWRVRLSRCWQSLSAYGFSTQDVRFVLVTTLLNNTIVPSIAIAFISANCFYNAIIAAPAVEDIYYVVQCLFYLVSDSLSRPECIYSQSVRLDISYHVPFQYSYQCASTIYVNYIPIYVFMFVGAGLLVPLTKVLITSYCNRLHQESVKNVWQKWLVSVLPHLYLAPHFVELPAASLGDDVVRAKVSPPQVSDQQLETAKTTTNDPQSVQSTKTPPPRLFQREKAAVQIVNYFAILLCFGTVYPPLAAIACVSFAVQSWASQYLVVSLLSRCWAVQQRGAGGGGGSGQDVVGFYADLLARQCRDVASLFGSLVLYVLPFFFLLVGYLVFDTAGYTGGWREGLWCWVLFAAWPTAIYTLFRWIANRFSFKRDVDFVKPSMSAVVSTTVSPIASSAAEMERNVSLAAPEINDRIKSVEMLGRPSRLGSRFSTGSSIPSVLQPAFDNIEKI